MLSYKENGLYSEIKKVTPKTLAIVGAFNLYCELFLNKSPVVTCVLRPFDTNNKNSLHPYYRAVDVRAKDWCQDDIDAISSFVNNIFPGKKPACYPHQPDPNNRNTLHFHLQDVRQK